MKILVVEDQLFVQNAITDMLFETRKDVQVDFLTSPYEAIEYLAKWRGACSGFFAAEAFSIGYWRK